MEFVWGFVHRNIPHPHPHARATTPPPVITCNPALDFIFFGISRLVRWLAPEDSREGVEAGRLKGVDC